MLVAVLTFCALTLPSVAAAQTEGIECGCPKTGPYVSDGQVVLTNVQGTYWGFSPDDDRFVFHYLHEGVHQVFLYDLSAAPASGRYFSYTS